MARSSDNSEIDRVAVAIGQNIREAMERLGVNNTQLGAAWGGNRQNVQHWVKGKHLPKASELPRLCGLLGISADALLGVRDPLQGGSAGAHRDWLLQLAERHAPKGRTAHHAPSKSQRRKAS